MRIKFNELIVYFVFYVYFGKFFVYLFVRMNF